MSSQSVPGTARRARPPGPHRAAFVLTALLLFTSLAGPLTSLQAAPVEVDNLDGTRTAVWDFSSPANLTLQDVSVAGGNVTLPFTSGTWLQTSVTDFIQGTGTNVTVLPNGTLTLGGPQLYQEHVAVSVSGEVSSISAGGSLEWSDSPTGAQPAITGYDWDGDGLRGDVVSVSGQTSTTARAWNRTGSLLWTNVNSATKYLVLSPSDHTMDGVEDEIVAAGDILGAIDRNGGTIWDTNIPGNTLSLAVADLDGDGFANHAIVGISNGWIRVFDVAGFQDWSYKMAGGVTAMAMLQNATTALRDRFVAGDEFGNVISFAGSGIVEWSTNTSVTVTAVASADFDGDGLLDDAAIGDQTGQVVHFDESGTLLGGFALTGAVTALSALDVDANGRWSHVMAGDDGGAAGAFDVSGSPSWALSVGAAITSGGAADLDGDGFADDSVFGDAGGFVTAVNSTGLVLWTYDMGKVVNDVARLQSPGGTPYYTDGLWQSVVLDAGGPASWLDLDWVATLPPSTNVSFRTRSGDVPVPDAAWSGWSSPLYVPPATITSPSSRYLQVEIVLLTADDTVRPSVLEFQVSYDTRPATGSVETEDYGPANLLAWDVFQATTLQPPSTGIQFSYSADGGGSWSPLSPGTNLSAAPLVPLRFRAVLSTVDIAETPSLSEMSIRYAYLGPLDHIHITPTFWVGTADAVVDFDAVAHDAYERVVPDALAWATDDPWGAVDANGTYQPGMIGSWRVYANSSDGSVSAFADVTVFPGALTRIGVQPWDPGTITTDMTLVFTATGYDQDGNSLGSIAATWSVTGGIGTLSPAGPTPVVILDPTTVGVGAVTADDGIGHTNTTADITVMAGALAQIGVAPPTVDVPTGGVANFNASGVDADGNPVPLAGSLWQTDAGLIVVSNDTAATLLAQASPLVGGEVNVTVGTVVGTATVNVIRLDTSPIINGVVPDQLKPEDYGTWVLDLTAYATDPEDPPSSLRWGLTGANQSLYTVSGLDSLGNHLLTFTTVSDAFGSNLVTLWLFDPGGNSASQPLWVNLTSVNDGPVIASIAPFAVHYDLPYSYNFEDYVEDVETPKSQLLLVASDGDHITFSGLWGTFTYPESMVGTTAYPVLTVWDADGASASTVLAITVDDNFVPSLTTALPDVVMFEGQELLDHFDLDDYFDDPDGEALFYFHGNSNVGIVIDEEHRVDFLATGDWFGSETVVFGAVDPRNARAEDTLSITVLPVNDAPTISGVPNLVVHYDDPAYPEYNYTFDLAPYIEDVDDPVSDLLVWTDDPANIQFYPPENMVMVIHYPQAMNGSVVDVLISVSDGLENASQAITITITDDWPPELLLPIPDQAFLEDTVLANAFNVSDHFMDPEGDALFYTSGNVSVLVAIDPVTHLVNFSAVPNWFGAERVTFRATDGAGALVEQTITVTVIPVNDPPTLFPIPQITLEVGETLVFDLREYILDVDDEFSDLSLNATGQHGYGFEVVGFNLILHYGTQVSSDLIRITVDDGEASTSGEVSVRVVPRAPPPLITGLTWPLLALIAVLLTVLLYLLAKRLILKMRIQEVFLIDRAGRLVSRVSGPGPGRTVDDDLFSAMLTAIQDFVVDSFAGVEGESLKQLDLGDKKVYIEKGELVSLVVIYRGFAKESQIETLQETLALVEQDYGWLLEKWDGSLVLVSGIESYLAPLLDKGLEQYLSEEGE